MSGERKIGRKNAIIIAAIGAASTACGNKNPEKITDKILTATNTVTAWLDKVLEPTETSAIQKKHEASPIITKAAATTTATPSPDKGEKQNTPSPTTLVTERATLTPTKENHDQENLNEVREARGGESISFEDALISYVVKLPRPFTTDIVYGVLAINENGEERGIAIIDNFDCGLEQLENANLLGKPIGSDKSPSISGLWSPKIRFENISGTTFVEPSLGTIALITGTSYQLKEGDQKTICPKDSIFSGLGDVPENLARSAGKLIRELIEGFKKGYFEENK